MASPERAQGAKRARWPRCQACGLSRGHQACGVGGHGAPARARYAPDRRLPGAPRARLSGGLHALAGALAQAAGLALGRACPVGGAPPHLRARGRDRGLPIRGILDGRGAAQDRPGRHLYRTAHPPRRQAARQAGARDRDGRPFGSSGDRGARPQGRKGRAQAGEQDAGSALLDLDLATGRLAQARLLGRPDDAHGPAPLRGYRSRRRDGRAHHLHADGQRQPVERGAGSCAAPCGRALRGALRATAATAVQDQGEKCPGGARGDPPDRPAPGAPGRGPPPRRRPASPLRADLEADRREPDGCGTPRPRDGRYRGPRWCGDPPGDRPDGGLRRLPEALSGRPRRSVREPRGGRRREPPAAGPDGG